MKSALYEGKVSHSRYQPKRHHFRYSVFMVCVFLSELDEFLSLSPFWSRKRKALARFRRADFHGDPSCHLDESVRRTIEKQLGWRPDGEIALLANFRYFGFNMNPLATYYCYDKSGEHVEAILAEVTNTPWGERRAYALDCRPQKVIGSSDKNMNQDAALYFQKDFTVSPFNTLDMTYRWSSTKPNKTLSLHIDCIQSESVITDATLVLKRIEASSRSLNRILYVFPFMTLKVFLAIYWQALRLFLKGVPFLGKNKRASDEVRDGVNP